MSIKKTAARGFSLIELLLVLSLAPIVFFAVYSNFSMGVRLWQRLQVSSPDEDLVIFSLKAEKDLANAMRLSRIPFEGESEELVFACAIEAPEELGGDRGIGRVRYFYDERARAILRETRDYSQVYKDKGGQITQLLSGVGSFEISYFFVPPQAAKPEWADSFGTEAGSNLPLAVRFTYTRDGEAGAATRTFFLAAGWAQQ